MLKKYSPKDVQFLFVSLDFAKELTTKVVPFVERRSLTPYVWLLDEPNPDEWIDHIEPTWQGDIPATLFLNPKKNKRIFLAKEFSTKEELEKQLQQLLD
ncbi:MAG: TlpA family protein disulfide reductase, partial [Flammeovirgaceae bacterium]|nr:TlpA family protein disulfide reductase [Flammeovirgaceae bacterium]